MLAALLLMVNAATPAPAPTPAPTPTPAPPSLRVLTPGGGAAASSAGTNSLAGMAKDLKLRLPADRRRVITNETVKELSAGVELTTAQSGEGGGDLDIGGPGAGDDKRAYWQGRYQAAKVKVADLEAEVERLEGEVARNERDFYAEDNPVKRDGAIKPAWDKALVDLRAAQEQLEKARKDPASIISAARRDGALPGWFRDLPRGAPATPAPSPQGP